MIEKNEKREKRQKRDFHKADIFFYQIIRGAGKISHSPDN